MIKRYVPKHHPDSIYICHAVQLKELHARITIEQLNEMMEDRVLGDDGEPMDALEYVPMPYEVSGPGSPWPFMTLQASGDAWLVIWESNNHACIWHDEQFRKSFQEKDA